METTRKYGTKGKQLGRTGLFYLKGDQVALSASLSKRFFARLLDLVLSALIGTSIFTAFYFTGIDTANEANVLLSTPEPYTMF
jgi:hypothetical protein